MLAETPVLVNSFKRMMNSTAVESLLYLYAVFASRRLREAERTMATPEDYVELAFRWHPLPFHIHDFFSIKPLQVKSEMIQLASIVSHRRPRTILEIGTARGGTLYLFSNVSDRDATIVSVDLPEGKYGGGYPRWKIPLYKSFAKEGREVHLIRKDSHDPLVLEQIRRILKGRMLDLLFIDGDHSIQGVTCDFRTYGPLVQQGGLIAFHDIVPHPSEAECDVSRLWSEIRDSYHYQEIIESENQGRCGIGLLFID